MGPLRGQWLPSPLCAGRQSFECFCRQEIVIIFLDKSNNFFPVFFRVVGVGPFDVLKINVYSSSSNAWFSMFGKYFACCAIMTFPMALESRIQTDRVHHLLTIVVWFFEVRISTLRDLGTLKGNNRISSPHRCSCVVPDKGRSPINKDYLIFFFFFSRLSRASTSILQ